MTVLKCVTFGLRCIRAKQLFSVSLKNKLKTIIPFSIQHNVFVLQWIISIYTVAAATQAIIPVHS